MKKIVCGLAALAGYFDFLDDGKAPHR